MSQDHHDEQMEAARRDFETLWAMELKPVLFVGKVDERANDADFAFIQQACWVAFTSGIEKAKVK